jgi:hypothetical protein
VSLYLTASGRSVTPQFPDDLAPWPELADAVENARRLEREYQEAAIADDRARLADARAKGQKKLPDARGVTEAQATLTECERQASAANDARRREAEIAVVTLEQHRVAYVRAAEDALLTHSALPAQNRAPCGQIGGTGGDSRVPRSAVRRHHSAVPRP